jgi:hypothetical protein
MTPNLSALVARADAAKQSLVILTAANETAAELAEAAYQRHRDTYAAVRKAADELQKSRAAIDAALDSDYGPLVAVPVGTASLPAGTHLEPGGLVVADGPLPEVAVADKHSES